MCKANKHLMCYAIGSYSWPFLPGKGNLSEPCQNQTLVFYFLINFQVIAHPKYFISGQFFSCYQTPFRKWEPGPETYATVSRALDLYAAADPGFKSLHCCHNPLLESSQEWFLTKEPELDHTFRYGQEKEEVRAQIWFGLLVGCLWTIVAMMFWCK